MPQSLQREQSRAQSLVQEGEGVFQKGYGDPGGPGGRFASLRSAERGLPPGAPAPWTLATGTGLTLLPCLLPAPKAEVAWQFSLLAPPLVPRCLPRGPSFPEPGCAGLKLGPTLCPPAWCAHAGRRGGPTYRALGAAQQRASGGRGDGLESAERKSPFITFL